MPSSPDLNRWHHHRNRSVSEGKNENVQLVGVDCRGSVYYDFWKTGELIEPYSYKVEGIGEDFFPSTINLGIIDEMYQLTDKQCRYGEGPARHGDLYRWPGGAVVRGLMYAERSIGPPISSFYCRIEQRGI